MDWTSGPPEIRILNQNINQCAVSLVGKVVESNEQNKLVNKIEPEAWIHGTD